MKSRRRFRGERLVFEATVAPKNFNGRAYAFSAPLAEDEIRFDFTLPEAKPWWPHGYGGQNLYRLLTRLKNAKGEILDAAESTFGVRTLQYAVAPGHEDYYPILLSVNGRKVSRKGTNWCTLDAMMRFDRAEYARFLVRAKEQGVNWIRAWGLGMVETDEFYDLCDELGILVRQEWPVGNGSHLHQPSDVLRDTVRHGVLRLRNRASLARGSQLVQAMALAPVMSNLRSFGDAVPGFSYYKLNTCGPNGSWAVVDWYGNPTIAYWWVKAFLNPVLAATRLPTFNFYNKKPEAWKVPVRLVDDFGSLSPDAKARVRVFDGRLAVVADVTGGKTFDVALDRRQIADGLRFVVAEVTDGGRILSRTWVPCNYDKVRGSLFALPKSELRLANDGKGKVIVRNAGPVPVVGVELSSRGHGDILHLSDNWFWLDPGESREVKVSFEDGRIYPISVGALNVN